MLWHLSLLLAGFGFIGLTEIVRRREPPLKRALLFWMLSLLGGLLCVVGSAIALVWHIRS